MPEVVEHTQYICITGTDTGIGKTVSAAAMALALQAQGYKTAVIKPVQTGISVDEPPDAAMITQLIGNNDIPVFQLYEYPAALAPHQAAYLAGETLPTLPELVAKIIETIKTCAPTVDYVIIEGAGGALVPLTADNGTILELAHSLCAVIVLVVRPNLGTLNHTSLTIEAMEHRGLYLMGIIVGAMSRQTDLATQLNLQEFESGKYGNLLGVIPDGSAKIPVSEFQKIASEIIDIDTIVTSINSFRLSPVFEKRMDCEQN